IATVGPLPSLTPFPTPSPRATPLESVGRTGEENDPTDGDSSRGVLNQLSNLDTSGFSRAFWNGALIVAIIFAALAAYLLFRGVFRRVWRFVQTKIFR
ncbi:MAG: hypothetical protein ACK2T3_14690, partial [Candidatus Promineifilaceae bacterium]